MKDLLRVFRGAWAWFLREADLGRKSRQERAKARMFDYLAEELRKGKGPVVSLGEVKGAGPVAVMEGSTPFKMREPERFHISTTTDFADVFQDWFNQRTAP